MRSAGGKGRIGILQLCFFGMGLLWLTPAFAQSSYPFPGMVIEDHVAVRAGAGTAYYVVGKLPKGATVHVDEKIFDWYKILPPKGVYSYVSRAFVDAKGDGKTGIVNKTRAAVKSASLNGPGDSFRRQVNLLKGDIVKIVGEEGWYYKIIPPKGAYVYIPISAIKPAKFTPVPPAPPAPPVAPVAVKTPALPTTFPAVKVTKAIVPKPTTQPLTLATTRPVTGKVVPSVRPVTKPLPVAKATLPVVAPPAPPAPPVPPVASPAPKTSVPSATPRPIRISRPLPGVTASAKPAVKRLPVVTTKPSVTAVVKPVPTTLPVVVSTPPAPPAPPVAPKVSTTPKVLPPALAGSDRMRFKAKSQALKDVEQSMIDAHQMSLDKRPFDALIKAYQKLVGIKGLPIGDQRIVAARLAQLRRDASLAQALNSITDAQGSIQIQAAPSAPVASPVNQNYDVVGQLLTSSVYDGTSLPRLYRLVNPADTRVTLYYVRVSKKDVLWVKHLGQVVGIVGEARYDSALKLQVMEPQQIDVLNQ